MIYVRIERINGRQAYLELAEWANQSGIESVDYNEGGWNDRYLGNIAPHLKFDRDEDAMAYVLAHGGEVSKTLPQERLTSDAE